MERELRGCGLAPRIALLATVMAGCGARTGAGELEERADATTRADAGARASCRAMPNCVEGEVTTPSGATIAFAGTALPEARMLAGDVWLTPPASDGVSLSIQIFRDVVPGPHRLSLSPTPSRYFVDLCTSTASCVLTGTGTLDRVDTRAGGATEGTFEGTARDCGDSRVRAGWFRITAPR